MTFHEPEANLSSAIADFHRARNQADLKELLARLTGDSVQLLSYDDVRKTLRLQGGVERGVQDIPLSAIVGSVGRYSDFTRDFLPRRDVSPERWARVKLAASGLIGLPPIDVYQIGEIYFVKDGNHRVSVARQLGATHIQAYVTEVNSRIPITKDDRPDDWILKAEYSQFLEETQLDLLRPQANLSVTVPGQYPALLEHIAIHRYFMGLDFKRDISYQEAVAHWYDTVYMPVVEILRSRGILHHFPGRTETDLYLWIAEHRAQLEHELGWPVRPEYAASHLVEEHSPGRNRLIHTLGRWIKVILPEKLESGPPPGQWHTEILPVENASRLFQDVLVPVNGKEDGWFALEQAIVLSQREHSNLHGLYIVLAEGEESTEAYAQTVQEEFERRCQAAGVAGRLIATSGEIVDQTCQRARTVDLVTVNLSYPPAPQMLARLNSGFRDLIQRCPRPILATPQTVSDLSRAFLAYDGSPKAQEALFIASYLASAWKTPLVVGSILDEGRVGAQTIQQAREYLEAHHVQAQYYLESGPIAETILKLSREENCELLILGGYGLNPLLEVVLGSQVDHVLRESCKPMLICQ
jgi:nucleotide-binding universal stress UspA family protein